MSERTPQFEFTMRYAEEDPEGYYYVRWDTATQATSSYRTWTAVVDKVRQLTPSETGLEVSDE